MTQKAEEGSLRPPQYLDEVEALIGLRAYEDLEKDLSATSLSAIPAERLGALSLLYTGSLRILATTRNEDRQAAIRQDGLGFEAAAFNDYWAQSLTLRGIATIADLCKAELRPIARQAVLRRNIERFLETEQGRQGLRPHQHPFMESITDFLQTGSTPVKLTDKAGGEVTYYSQGATVVAPTGIGKTVLMAHTVKGIGIAKAVKGARRGEQPLRALIVVPSQDLVRQFTGEVGDNTFRRFAPGINVGSYYAQEKDNKANVVVITRNKFRDDFKDGQLHGETFDIALIDEVHHLTSPDFLEAFRQHWRGPVIGFTATPDYSLEKDARAILPHEIYHGDTINYIEDGVLNAGQLFAFRVDPREHRELLAPNTNLEDPKVRKEAGESLLDQSVVDFAISMLKEGRRGMIFCEYGDQSAHARHLANLLSNAERPNGEPIILPDGKPIRAEAIGKFRKARRDGFLSPKVIKEYYEGKVHVITTTEMGSEGLNADIDFIIVARPVLSLLKFKQIIGRGTRLSTRFPTTVYAQFFIAPEPGGAKTLTVYEAFGLEEVNQGVRIGPRSRLANNRQVVKIGRLPGHLKKMSEPLHLRPLSEALAAPGEMEVPPGYKSLDRMLEGTNYTVDGAKRLFWKLGFAWVGRTEVIDGERTFVRYYEPTAETYLKKNEKGPPVSRSIHTSITELSRQLDLSTHFVNKIVKELVSRGSVSLAEHTERGRRREYLDRHTRAVVKRYISEIPVAGPDDRNRSAKRLAWRLGYSDVEEFAAQEGITLVWKQLPNTQSKIFQQFVEKDVAQRLLEAKFGKTVVAEVTALTYMTRADISREVGINQSETNRLMTEEEFALGQTTLSGKTTVWPTDAGMKIAERLKSRRQSLPPHLVPLVAVVSAVLATVEGVRGHLKRTPNIEAAQLTLPGAPKTTCYLWAALREAQRQYGANTQFKIKWDLLPQSSNDTDPEHIAYAKGVQYLLVPEKRLGFSSEELQNAKAMAHKIRRGLV